MFANPIHIYIASTLKLPSDREGVTGFMIETVMPNGSIKTHHPEYRHLNTGNMTPDSSRLWTVKVALNFINVESIVIVHLDDARLAGLWEMDMPRRWASTGWKTTRGGEVKNREMWQGILSKVEEKGLSVTMSCDPGHNYVKMLKIGCEERAESGGDF